MPYWAVIIVVVVLVVAYYSSTAYARQKRRDSVGGGFAKIQGFHANQVFIDSGGDAAVGIDDRGRRIGVSRKRGEPRVRTYAFNQLASAEIVRDDRVLAQTSRDSLTQAPIPGGSLFGSTRAPGGAPSIATMEGTLSLLGVRLVFDLPGPDTVLLRFYQGKPVDAHSLAADKAVGQARALFGALEVALKRASLPPRPVPSPPAPDLSGGPEEPTPGRPPA